MWALAKNTENKTSEEDAKQHTAGDKLQEEDVKGKVVPVLFLTEHHAIKAYWGSGGIAPRIP
jgi:hypothetical protein